MTHHQCNKTCQFKLARFVATFVCQVSEAANPNTSQQENQKNPYTRQWRTTTRNYAAKKRPKKYFAILANSNFHNLANFAKKKVATYNIYVSLETAWSTWWRIPPFWDLGSDNTVVPYTPSLLLLWQLCLRLAMPPVSTKARTSLQMPSREDKIGEGRREVRTAGERSRVSSEPRTQGLVTTSSSARPYKARYIFHARLPFPPGLGTSRRLLMQHTPATVGYVAGVGQTIYEWRDGSSSTKASNIVVKYQVWLFAGVHSGDQDQIWLGKTGTYIYICVRRGS